MPKDINRSQYTERILDIVKSVKRQKLDIDKILIDTRGLQKEINTVSDTLGRVFAVVDEQIFQDATKTKDEASKTSYKNVASINSNFDILVNNTKEEGDCKNTILDLENKTQTLGKKVAGM